MNNLDNSNNPTFLEFVIFFGVIGLLASTFFLMLHTMGDSIQSVAEQLCANKHGTLIFYECFNSINSHCENLKTGYWCQLNNGTEIDINDEIKILNEL